MHGLADVGCMSMQLAKRHANMEICLVMEFCNYGSLQQALEWSWFHDQATGQPIMVIPPELLSGDKLGSYVS